MKLAVCHLSDIHIAGDHDPVLGRAEAIVSAVQPRVLPGMGLLLICSGDVAFSGKREQYILAGRFLERIRDGLRDITGVTPLGLVIVPGNHDCDFSEEGDARPILIPGLTGKLEAMNLAGKSLQEVLRVQANFFGFAGQFAEPRHDTAGPRASWTLCRRLDKRTIRICCVNTAIFSQLNEQPGQLHVPLQAIPGGGHGADFALTVFHHPYPWLSPNNRREFQRRIELASDLVLTGHEHDGANYARLTPDGETDYVEGAALNAEGQTGFNLVVVDLDESTNQVLRFTWNGEIYEPSGNASSRVFVRKRSLIESRFELDPQFAMWLRDVGTGFSHPRGELALDSIFVCPDLAVISLASGARRIIRSAEVLPHISDAGYIHIAGAALSGRTTLARVLYDHFRQALRLVPVLIDGADIRASSREELDKAVERAAGRQYQIGQMERFRQLRIERKVLLIDNWNACRLPAKQKARVISGARASFGKVILFSDDASIYRLLNDATDDPNCSAVEFCEIQQLGYRLRSELIRKWHSFGEDPQMDDLELASRTATSENVLDSLVGRGIVPSWPIFVLSLLQADSIVNDQPAAYGSYGHLYEALITKRLAASTKQKKSLGQKYTILSMLAYEIFRLGKQGLAEAEVHEVHARYEREYHAPVDRQQLLADLEAAQIWIHEGGEFRFRYKYAYYFFVAKYFQEGIGNAQEADSLRAQLAKMVNCVHDEDCANLLIFYIYLSKDRAVIEDMLSVASRIFSDRSPAELITDIEFVNKLRSKEPDISLGSADVDKNREERRARMDDASGAQEAISSQIEERTEYSDTIPESLKVEFAFKSIHVMGQVVKNFPLDLRGDLKLGLVRESYGLTLRALATFLRTLESNVPEILSRFERALKTLQPTSERSHEQLRDASKMFMVRLAELGIFGMIKRLSLAVGAAELGDTYRQVRQLAGESDVPTRLIDLCIKLDHFGHIPESDVRDLEHRLRGNITAYTILRLLIVEFLNLFPCDYKTQQRMVELFKFQPRAIRATEKKVRKLGGSPT